MEGSTDASPAVIAPPVPASTAPAGRRRRGRPPSTTARPARDQIHEDKKRCQDKMYLELKRDLAHRDAEIKQLKRELTRERQQRGVIVAGERRRMQVEIDLLTERCASLENYAAELKRHRNSERAKLLAEMVAPLEAKVALVEDELRTAKLENEALTDELATLKRSRAAFRREAERKRSRLSAGMENMQNVLSDALARATDLEARAVASEARALHLETRAIDFEARAANSESRAADSESRAADSEVRAANAEARRLEAQNAAAQLSSREQQMQKEMEDVLQEYKDAAAAAESAKALAEQKAKLLHAKVDDLKMQLQLHPKLPANRSVDEWALLGCEAKWKASQRERLAFRSLLDCHECGGLMILPKC